MQTPICEICLTSNFLCSSCQSKLDSGKINDTEIEVSRFLFELSDKVKTLKDVKIRKIFDSGVLLIIASSGDGPKLVGKYGYVVKELAKKFKKSIRIVEEAESIKKFVEDFVSPITVSGINTLYTKEEEIYRIRIPFSQRNSLTIQPENFSTIISDLYNKKAEIIFD